MVREKSGKIGKIREKSGKVNYYIATIIVQMEICNIGVRYLIKLFVRCSQSHRRNCISYTHVQLWHLLTYDFVYGMLVREMSAFVERVDNQ